MNLLVALLVALGAAVLAGLALARAPHCGTVAAGGLRALVFAGCVALALQLSMADPRERVRVQSLLVAGCASVVAAGLLIVNFLDHPYQPHIGGIQPNAMRQTLRLVDGPGGLQRANRGARASRSRCKHGDERQDAAAPQHLG